MEFADCSLWHHLIFCEKLVIDAKETVKNVEEFKSNAEELESDTKELKSGAENNFVCSLCEEAVSGCPAYKCLECKFLQHASCPKRLGKDHDFGERHHLLYVEEMENNGNEVVVCMGCRELACGLAYRCSIPECSFLLEKSCAHLSHVAYHAVHPDHTFTLRMRYSLYCDVCGDKGRLFLVYYCPTCDFDIHIKCLSRWRISADDDHQHEPFPLRKLTPFTCQACGGDEREGRAYVCSVCRLLTHLECGKFPHTIKVTTHDHSLRCKYSIPQVKKQDLIFCNLCYKKVNTEGGAYYCQQCNYIVYMWCAKYREDERQDASVLINFNEYKAHMVYLVENARDGETASPLKMNHFSHPQHELILNDEEPQDEKRCEACMLLIIFPPFYSCQDCSFFLHHKCAKLPQTVTRGPFHGHPLTAVTTAPSTKVFMCYHCDRLRHGFAYTCNKCGWPELDVQCLFIPETLNHQSHLHPLFLAPRSDERCNSCGKRFESFSEVGKFQCTNCQFTLCWACVTLPLVTRHPCDPHILKLTHKCEDDSKEYYCFICEEKRDPKDWFYYCEECDFVTHIQCALGKNSQIKFGKTLHKENHQHPLKFVQTNKEFVACAYCNEGFRHGVALECTQCNIHIHYDCEKYWLY